MRLFLTCCVNKCFGLLTVSYYYALLFDTLSKYSMAYMITLPKSCSETCLQRHLHISITRNCKFYSKRACNQIHYFYVKSGTSFTTYMYDHISRFGKSFKKLNTIHNIMNKPEITFITKPL